jgi:hypothetical protein
MSEEIQVIEGEPITEEDEFWMEQGKELLKNSIEAIESAGKQLITLLTTIKGVYLGAVAYSQFVKSESADWEHIILILPLIFWLIALRTALDVFRTKSYEMHLNQPEEIREKIRNIAEYKQGKLNVTYAFIVVGFLAAIIAIAVYFAVVN